MWNSSTRSAAANVPATSPNSLRVCGAEMLSPRLANSGGLAGSSATAAFATGGRSVVVDLDQLAAILGQVPALGDDDRDRIADQADLVRGEQGELGRGPAARPSWPAAGPARGPSSSSMSAPVSTATTPGSARAAEASTERIRA